MISQFNHGETARLGAYEVLGRLGEGGMGTVYLARDAAGRKVAVKVIRAELSHDENFRRRFRSEVTRARQVPPFCTAEVLDADPDHDPPYLVVEYVDGPSLTQVVQEQGPLTGTALHSLAVGVATALTAIHGSGVIHRDLKPGNVLLTLGGIKVIDFGLARALEATSQLTRTGHMVGTISYMAPERFDSEEHARLSPAADIFSWGAVVTYAATGRTPFGADSVPGTAVRIMTQPPAIDGLPLSLREAVSRALAKQPHDRPTARELLDLLLAAAPSAASPSSRTGHETPFLRETVQASGHRPAGPPLAPPRSRATRPAQPLSRAARPAQSPGRAAGPAPSRGRAHRTGSARPWPTRPDLGRWPLRVGLAALTAALLAGGLGARALLTDRDANAAQNPGTTTPAGPSAQPMSGSVPADPVDGILAGHRRTLLHIAGSGQNLVVRSGGTVAISPATDPETEFTLVPRGDAYLIRSLRPGLPAGKSCLTVRPVRGGDAGTLTPGACADHVPALFDLAPTGERDKENRPTYRLRNRVHGVVRWSDDRFEIFVEHVDDELADTTFSLLDRGPA